MACQKADDSSSVVFIKSFSCSVAVPSWVNKATETIRDPSVAVNVTFHSPWKSISSLVMLILET